MEAIGEDLDPHEIRMAVGQSAMERIEMITEESLILTRAMCTTTQDLARHLSDEGLNRANVVAYVIGVITVQLLDILPEDPEE